MQRSFKTKFGDMRISNWWHEIFDILGDVNLMFRRQVRTSVFVCPFIVSVFFLNYNQQDANIFDYLFLKGSTCFGRFLRPSSGAHNCKLSFRYCQPILLQAGIVDEVELFHLSHDTSLQQYWLTIPEDECTVMCFWWWAEEPSETCIAF